MKQGHLFVMFLTIYVTCFLVLYTEQKKYDSVLKEKQKIEQALLSASYSAAESYEKVINETEEIRKKIISEVFFESFSVAMGGFESQQEQDLLKMYIPLIILAEEEGAFFFSLQEIQTEDGHELGHVWSDKIMYSAPGMHGVTETIEETASSLVSKHNYIASQYGISYQFHVPQFLINDAGNQESITIFVVFQGWPLTAAGDVIYENCVDAGIYIEGKRE